MPVASGPAEMPVSQPERRAKAPKKKLVANFMSNLRRTSIFDEKTPAGVSSR